MVTVGIQCEKMDFITLISLVITNCITAFITFKGVSLGLRWQIQTEQNKEPTLTIPNPIKEHIEARKTQQQVQFTTDVMDEWLNGPKEGG